MYIKNQCKINDKIEIEKHYPGNFGAPGIKREKKRKKTPEEMAKQNLWRKIRDLRRTMELNFHADDWHVTLTCRREDRPIKEEAPKVIRSFRDDLRKEYKAQGWALNYIITTETGKRGAVHWHMIVNNLQNEKTNTAKIIRALWIRGRPYFVPLDEGGEYGKLAEYIVKETTQRIQNEETIEKLSYMASRNLIKPTVYPEKIRSNSWRKFPDAPKGYQLVEESLVNGFNKFTGLPYQYYTIKKYKKGGEDGEEG